MTLNHLILSHYSKLLKLSKFRGLANSGSEVDGDPTEALDDLHDSDGTSRKDSYSYGNCSSDSVRGNALCEIGAQVW